MENTLGTHAASYNAGNNPFLNLPAEIRNKIWQHAVKGHTTTRTINPKTFDISVAAWAPPAITRVSHQTRNETMLMYYHNNGFIFHMQAFDLFLPLLRRALSYFKATHPGKVLENFELKMDRHFPVAMDDLVEFVRMCRDFDDVLPAGLLPLHPDTGLESLPEYVDEFRLLLTDLATLGRHLPTNDNLEDTMTAIKGLLFSAGEHKRLPDSHKDYRECLLHEDMLHLARMRQGRCGGKDLKERIKQRASLPVWPAAEWLALPMRPVMLGKRLREE